jgi:hypothetical protein
MPRSGKLHFDFSWASRPSLDEVVITDSKFLKIMVNLALIEDAEDLHALSRMAMMKKEAKKALSGTGATVYEIPLEEAMQIGLKMSEFYDELLNRDVLFRNAGKNEEIHVTLSSGPPSRPSTEAASRRPNSTGGDSPSNQPDIFDPEAKNRKLSVASANKLRDQLYRTMSVPAESVPVNEMAASVPAAAAPVSQAPSAALERSASMPPDVHAAAMAAESSSKPPTRAIAKSEMRLLM